MQVVAAAAAPSDHRRIRRSSLHVRLCQACSRCAHSLAACRAARPPARQLGHSGSDGVSGNGAFVGMGLRSQPRGAPSRQLRRLGVPDQVVSDRRFSLCQLAAGSAASTTQHIATRCNTLQICSLERQAKDSRRSCSQLSATVRAKPQHALIRVWAHAAHMRAPTYTLKRTHACAHAQPTMRPRALTRACARALSDVLPARLAAAHACLVDPI